MHMFLYFGAVVGVMPFTTVLAKQLGISAALAGLVNTTLLFLSILMRFAIGSLTDKMQQLKIVLIAVISVESFFHFLLIFVPPIKPITVDIGVPAPESVFQNDTRLLCFSHTYIDDCQPHSPKPCRMRCRYSANESSSITQDIAFPFNCSLMCHQTQWCLPADELAGDTNGSTFLEAADKMCTVSCHSAPNTMSTPTFWMFAIFRVLGGTAFGVGISLADAAAYAMLRDRKEDYGKQRLWGTIGWGALAPLIGYLNEIATGDSHYIDYSPGFYMMAAFTVLDLVSLCFLDVPRSTTSKQLLKDLTEVLVNPRALFFTFSVLNMGFLMGFVWSYGLWYLQDLGASPTLLGANLAVQCFGGEVPVLFFSGWIIKRIGYGNAVSLSIAGLSLRLAVYSFGTDPWSMLPVEVTHGLCFGLFYAAMTSYASSAAPPGTEATMQGILGGTFEGLGIASGTLVAGQLYTEMIFTVRESRRESLLRGSQQTQPAPEVERDPVLTMESRQPDGALGPKDEDDEDEVV
ncbi:hypothetical protein MTO96_014287 [Rhipicephalus appendiculatus]